MIRRFAFPGSCLGLLLGIALHSAIPEGASAALFAGEKTLILYDAASGTIPGAPLMSFTAFPPGVALPTFSNEATVMDTGVSGMDTYAGWTANESMTPDFPILDRTAGFQVDFTVQIEQEDHNDDHRSGFSLILLSDDAKGLELAFWKNEIWAQSDGSTGGLFEHG